MGGAPALGVPPSPNRGGDLFSPFSPPAGEPRTVCSAPWLAALGPVRVILRVSWAGPPGGVAGWWNWVPPPPAPPRGSLPLFLICFVHFYHSRAAPPPPLTTPGPCRGVPGCGSSLSLSPAPLCLLATHHRGWDAHTAR